MKISVITPTIRKDGLKIVREALSNQSFTDYEWLICSKFDPEIPEARWIPDTFDGGFWTLNRAYNLLFKSATAPLIVSWQDNIWIPPDGLQKFADAYERLGDDVVISGVGDQYESIGKYGQPEIKIWSDPRKTDKNGSFYECYPNDAEWNWCAIPRSAIYKIGGMDEKLDFLGYGGDQLQAVQRMDEVNVRFFLDQSNESFTLRHGRDDFGGQTHWDENHVLFNGKYEQRKKELKETGKWPVLDNL